jgi:hypothetical protein
MKPDDSASSESDKELLRRARKAFGSTRGWKLAISTAWMYGNYEAHGLDSLAGELQSLRNRRGPRWLHDTRLGKDNA